MLISKRRHGTVFGLSCEVAMKYLFAVFLLFSSFIAPLASAQTVEDGYVAYDAGDFARAKDIFLSLAEVGDAKAMNAIGILYDEGKAYSKDRKTACDWYEKSANVGYAAAQNNLAICYEDGDGRPQDLSKTIYWMEQAAKQDYVNAQTVLVRLYKDTDPEKAQYWGQKAIDQGSAFARVVMWGFDIPHTGHHASRMDIVCVLVMNRLLDRKMGYCDYKN